MSCSAYDDSVNVVVRTYVCVATATLSDEEKGSRMVELESFGAQQRLGTSVGVLLRDGGGPAKALNMLGWPGRRAQLTRPGWRGGHRQAGDRIEDG